MEGCLKFFLVAFIILIGIFLGLSLLVNGLKFAIFHPIGSMVAVAVISLATVSVIAFVRINERNVKRDQAERAERRQIESEKEQRRQLREEQLRCRREMDWITNQSIEVYELMPSILSEVESLLDKAEVDRKENAAWPFWDLIEKSTNQLGRFYEATDRINKNSTRYQELVKVYVGSPRKYPLTKLSISRMSTGSESAAKLHSIVRVALRNNVFASMYEQRKTNRVLIEGFTNLGQALDQMSNHISSALNNVASSVDTLSRTMADSMHTMNARMAALNDILTDIHDNMSEYQYEQAARERKASDMLDDIRRGRKPFVSPSPFI